MYDCPPQHGEHLLARVQSGRRLTAGHGTLEVGSGARQWGAGAGSWVDRKERMRRIWQDTKMTSTRFATTDELNVLRHVTNGLNSHAKNWAKPAARHAEERGRVEGPGASSKATNTGRQCSASATFLPQPAFTAIGPSCLPSQ